MPTYKITVEGIFMVDATNVFDAHAKVSNRFNGPDYEDVRTHSLNITSAPVIPEGPGSRDTWIHFSPHFMEGKRCTCDCTRCTDRSAFGVCICPDCQDKDHRHYMMRQSDDD